MLKILETAVETERKKLLAFAKRIVPHLTAEDILQPQDYPELEQCAEFRYLEGVCVGLETALHIIYAEKSALGVPEGTLPQDFKIDACCIRQKQV